MSSYDGFEATHRVVATSDDAVAACKRALVSRLRGSATELRVFVHPTERAGVPESVTDLHEIDPKTAEFAGDETEFRGTLPDGEEVVEAVLAEMDTAGRIPVSALYFGGDGFAALVTASTSHLHVGKLRCDDSTLSDESALFEEPSLFDESALLDEPSLLDELSDGLDGVGVIVPAGPAIGWERAGTYFELDGPKLCVYDERPATPETRATTSHACHDLTRLAAMDSDPADGTEGRIELTWRAVDSFAGKAIEAVFGRPPTELVVPAEEFDAVETYLGQFLSEPASSVSK